ncbi:hypothetical protein CR513_43443, partial [Mucuna pruriens]
MKERKKKKYLDVVILPYITDKGSINAANEEQCVDVAFVLMLALGFGVSCFVHKELGLRFLSDFMHKDLTQAKKMWDTLKVTHENVNDD